MENDTEREMNFVEDTNTSVRKQYLAACAVSLCTFSYGSTLGWVSPSSQWLQSPSSPVQPPLSSHQLDSVASLYCVGAFGGVLIFGLLNQHFGRRGAGLLLAVPYALCWILKLSVNSFEGLLVARVSAGISGGASLLLAPQYCLEIGSVHVRGALGSISILALNVGLLYAYTIGAFLSYQLVLWLQLAVPLVFFVTFYFMPETPVYLVKSKKYTEAIRSIAWLRRLHPEDLAVDSVLDQLKHEDRLASSEDKAGGWKDVFIDIIKSKPTVKAFLVCFVLTTVQGFVGIFAIMSFASEIFHEAGSSLSPELSAIVLALLQMTGSCASILLVERLGRKALFITSSSIFGLGLCTLGVYFHLKQAGHDLTALGWLPVVALSLGVAVDAIGVGPVPFIFINEVFSIQARGLATTALIFWVWVTQFLQTQFYTDLMELVGPDGIFWGFSAVAFSGSLFCIFFVPETKGRPLEEIIRSFE